MRLKVLSGNGYSSNRRFSVFNEFSKKIKGEANRYFEATNDIFVLKRMENKFLNFFFFGVVILFWGITNIEEIRNFKSRLRTSRGRQKS